MRKTLVTAAILVLFATACASKPAKRSDASTPAMAAGTPPLSDSSIDISYVLGHSHRRFLAKAKDSNCVAQSYFDQQILKENEIDGKHYEEFFSKVSKFMTAPQRVPAAQAASSEECRSPFTVTVRLGKKTQAFQGCRGSDEGALAHLVKDGEFLLFSKK
jgi:hypothetical protein